MTKFDNKRFDYNGMYLKYDGKFVARFKYGGMVSFKKFLRDNFTVKEYFETKGYVDPKIAKILKRRGYPMTLEGMNQMIDDDIARRTA